MTAALQSGWRKPATLLPLMLPLERNIDGRPSLHGRTMKMYVRGTHRLIPPAETLARVKPLLPKMGITRLANVTGLDVIGIPVVMSVRPCSRSLSVSQGKGLDLDSAKVSAAMESIEGYHAERVDPTTALRKE